MNPAASELANRATTRANTKSASIACRGGKLLELEDLRLVQAIDAQGSLVRAARTLGLAQPALTRRLASLEARLGGRLFERGHKGATPTDLARVVLQEAATLIEGMERLERTLALQRSGQVADLIVACGAFAGELLATPVAARMLGEGSSVRLRLVTASWSAVPAVLLEREASLGLMDLLGVPEDPGLEVEPLTPQPGLFFARPGHPLAGRRELDAADILAWPTIFIGRIPRERLTAMLGAREAAAARGPIHRAFPALIQDSPSQGLRMLANSDAVTPVPIGLAREAMERGEVVPLAWRAPWVSVAPGLLRRRGTAPSPPEASFMAHLREEAERAAGFAREVCARLGVTDACA
jgi:DNA-binding transcriptional LysR family regulator